MNAAIESIQLNGINVGAIQHRQDRARNEPSSANRNPRLVAQWVGETRARVACGDVITYLGGDGELDSMQVLLAALAACDVEVIALHAALLGLPIASLSVEASGHFNVSAYLGVEAAPGPGYDAINYVVRLRAPQATLEQIEKLRQRLDHASPVGDSLARAIPMEVKLEVEG